MDLTAITFTELRYVVAVADTGLRTLAAFIRARVPSAAHAVAP